MASRCKGFRFAAVSSGIKSSGALDLGLITCDGTASGAAVFTKNRLAAASVVLSRRSLKRTGGLVSSVVVNSGNANACTGRQGALDAKMMQRRLANHVDGEPNRSLVASTGVIGSPLPTERVGAGIDAAAAGLSIDGFAGFSEAILTTDRGPKTATRKFSLGSTRATVLGCTKGAGMIAPNMATTLTFVVTDIAITPARLAPLLENACDQSFNAITVDGDTSTNDMILVLSSGASAARVSNRAASKAFGEVLTDLLSELASDLMRDGEGVSHVAKIVVTGAKTTSNAKAVARAIAISPLVKTAIGGCDPNWGRILCAAGNAGVALSPATIGLDVGSVAVVRGGVAVADLKKAESRAAKVMGRSAYTITLDLGRGAASAHYLACDLSHQYVTINADYRT